MCKIVTPVVTVFDENEKPDYEGNKKVIDFLIEGGVDGILVLGSSGEFTGLTKQEKHDFFNCKTIICSNEMIACIDG